MAKCRICKKKGLFLKIDENGVCPDCVRLARIEKRRKSAEKKLAEEERELEKIKTDKDTLLESYKAEAIKEIEDEIVKCNDDLQLIRNKYNEESIKLQNTSDAVEKANKQLDSQSKKILKLKELYEAMKYSLELYNNSYNQTDSVLIRDFDKTLIDNLSPTVHIQLNSLNYKDLRKKFTENDKAITSVAEKYQERYSSKTVAAIYKLMVIALRAELQNILTGLKFGNVETAIDQIKATTSKYLSIATDGNQTIAGTLVRFIGEIEYLFIEAAKIEYEYYIQKEQIKEEQRALKEQLKQEALERKLLEQQQKQVAKEEEKYKNEIESLKESLRAAVDAENSEKENILNLRIQDLERQLKEVDKKKEQITKLQNGKAGYVYVISNLGSFGNNVFKIGMTRRLEPQERIDELGSASVPFPFDVHSFIFSDNAPELETNIHKILDAKRMNKVNLRKEFFRVDLDELEKIVYEIQPTAEFNRTMLAEQYNQSLSIERGIAQAFDNALEELNDDDDEEVI